MGKIKNKLLIDGIRYPILEKKGYPLDEYTAKKVIKLRLQQINMKKTIKLYNERIIIKEDLLKNLYAEIKKKLEKYEQKNETRGSS